MAMFAGMFVGILLGPSVGWVSPETGASVGNWLAFPGQLFLATIQMIVIPLVFASIIRGLAASESINQLKQLGIVSALFFLVTTAISAMIGLAVANLIEPGEFLQIDGAVYSAASPAPSEQATPPSWSEMPSRLIGLLPGNPLDAMVKGQMLQVVIFSIIVGIALISMPFRESKPIIDLLGSLQQVCMTIVRWAMVLAPFAVFGLMARLTSQIGLEALLGMAVYVLTVLVGLLILFGFYLSLVALLTREKATSFLIAIREVMLLAFSTSSSAAVMPLSIRTAEEKLSIRPSVSQFVIPLGATINMNGTALYHAVAAVFLAQVFNIDISLGGMALIVVMTVSASIGSPATPGVGIVILSLTLTSIGVPAAGIALIMGVDRILDMSRTAINVMGDLVAAKLLNGWFGLQQDSADDKSIERDKAALTVNTTEGSKAAHEPEPSCS
jgi:Na+/H+-dicarboxylate symporter